MSFWLREEKLYSQNNYFFRISKYERIGIVCDWRFKRQFMSKVNYVNVIWFNNEIIRYLKITNESELCKKQWALIKKMTCTTYILILNYIIILKNIEKNMVALS